MGKITGFKEYSRSNYEKISPEVRIKNWGEMREETSEEKIRTQASRCMSCGIPFCSAGIMLPNGASGCPLHNLIPEWNDLTWRGLEREALDRLHATNNFPEFTGRLCPAPCETACVVGINRDAVTIKNVEFVQFEDLLEAYADLYARSASPGNDTIDGGLGDDTISGGAGADHITFGGGRNLLRDQLGDLDGDGVQQAHRGAVEVVGGRHVREGALDARDGVPLPEQHRAQPDGQQ